MLTAALAALFGLLIGSFLNVCIFRFPRDLSVVRPRSFCPECEKTIAWYDNIPLLSFFLLRGKCRHCGKPIPARYPVVEALTAALFFSFVAVLGPTLPAFKFCLLSALLVGMIFADFEELILPDEFTIGGILAGLALSWFVPIPDGMAQILFSIAGATFEIHRMSLADSILGAAIPSGFLWMIGALYEKFRKREGLGFGDVKMVAAIGAFLGLHECLLTLIAGSLLGSMVGLIYILAARKDHASYQLPFGTFLGIAAIGVSLTSQRVVAWYTSLFRSPL